MTWAAPLDAAYQWRKQQRSRVAHAEWQHIVRSVLERGYGMKRLTQTKLHDPEHGVVGNCYSACLAMVLGLNVSEVPDFDDGPSAYWYVRVREWLKERGYAVIRVCPDPDHGWEGVLLDVEPGAVTIHSGLSPRSPTKDTESPDKILHSVVAVRGKGDWEYLDPHPSGDGLADPLVAIELIVKYAEVAS